MPELRIDPIVGRRVYIAEDRAGRPQDYADAQYVPQRRQDCPFCAGHEYETPDAVAEINGADGQWHVRVVPNKYPALADAGPARGVHEVIIESPRHVATVPELDESQLARVVVTYRDRLRYCAEQPGLAAGIVFKNSGHHAGASLEHVHSQLIATPYVPQLLAEEAAAAAERFDALGTCPFCDLIASEQKSGVRVIADADGLLAVTAYAGRQPMESWILPTRHGSDFLAITDGECAAVARMLLRLTGALERVAPGAAFNLVLHTAPFEDRGARSFHWHWELIPRLSRLAGMELGGGVHINPLAPEHAAQKLRAALGA
ncbi:MAG: galactose-1-phosphate uridylyltransferase [Planctomycetaceae bacterium]|nr:galactose-1-phosphate uridylyltransferase [Planctomycetaceae bacterium]